MEERRACLMILADGAKAETFERLLAAGELPNVSEHVVERGSYRRAASTFTSTTGPAHIPLLSGCFPGTANVPGYRWFDRSAYRGRGPAGFRALRSLNGPEASWLGRDMDAGARTLYEILPDSVGVFGVITRGLDGDRNIYSARKGPIWFHSHYRHDYARADRHAAASIPLALDTGARFAFIAFPGIDWNSHYLGVDGPEAIEAYRRVDEAVGLAAGELKRRGSYESTLIMVVSDHGHCEVREHFDLPVELGRRWGIRTAYHSFPAFRARFDAVACVSGNGMAHVYLRGGDGWSAAPQRESIDHLYPGLREGLLAEPSVDLIITRGEAPGQLVVESRRGRALLWERGRGDSLQITYEPDGGDPFGWADAPRRMDGEQALAAGFDSGHPDALVQIAQIFRSPRCGDLVVSAMPGHDLRERFEHPEHVSSHGALHRDHMLTPFASSAPLEEGPMRTADAMPSVLAWLGEPIPEGIDGVSRLS